MRWSNENGDVEEKEEFSREFSQHSREVKREWELVEIEVETSVRKIIHDITDFLTETVL